MSQKKPSLKELEIKKNGGMYESELAEFMSKDDEIIAGRVRNSSACMESATKRFDESAKAILKANDRLLQSTIDTERLGKAACQGVKSTVNSIKDQLGKVDSILGDNVEHKIKQLERIADALTVIHKLSSDAKTMSAVKAMTNHSL